ncbi:MAG: 2-amino-4-hydroxy-6-hydroxymethyldihydropteridine diphosphokinase [Lentisphaerae bacterium]|nr:2-amino-4-hydroxy-6-hydroxymethyldihydropteridine diphosphokinase [Lentisphaerota bacterium]
MSQIVVMLGGNLPGSREAMASAVKKFAFSGVENIVCSKVITSTAEDCVPGTPDFLDMALTGEWDGSTAELLALCQQFEREAGRPEKHSSRESRILDCDIIFFDDMIVDTPQLTIPHPRAQKRRFVLEPLSEIAPELCFPDGTTVLEALNLLGNQ